MTKVQTRVKRYISCPNCDEGEHIVEHLIERKVLLGADFGPWRCSDCLRRFSGKAFPDGEVEITSVETDKDPYLDGYALLKLDVEELVNDGALYFVVKDSQFGSSGPEQLDYHYHSHQCPTNLLSRIVEMVTEKNGTDEHGLLRFVSWVRADELTEDAFNKVGGLSGTALSDVFEIFKSDGTLPPTIWPSSNRGMLG